MTPARENITIVQGESFHRVARLCSHLRTVTDAIINAASTSLSSKQAGFLSSDAGRRVLIVGAGVGGSTLDTTIASITSTSIAVLSVAASVGVSKARCRIISPVNLTGYSAKSQVRETEESVDVLQEMDITIDAAAGKITRDITAADTVLLVARRSWHDLRVTDAAGNVSVKTRGYFTVLSRITQ